MSCMAYHQETLRKARIQERAREAQKNMQQQSASAHANQRREPLEPYQPTASYSSDPRRLQTMVFNVDYPVKHRKVDNTTVDRVAPLLCPPPRPVTTHGYHCPPSCQSADQSRRRVHYKVTHSFESNHQGHRMAQLQRGASSHPEQRQMSSDAFQGYVHKDLKMQEKTLRNHNMVMGPMEAFDDLLNPRNYKTYRPSSQHY